MGSKTLKSACATNRRVCWPLWAWIDGAPSTIAKPAAPAAPRTTCRRLIRSILTSPYSTNAHRTGLRFYPAIDLFQYGSTGWRSLRETDGRLNPEWTYATLRGRVEYQVNSPFPNRPEIW